MSSRLSLRQLIKNNFHIKVTCFVLAVIIYIFYQSSLVDKKNLVVPLVVIEDGSMIHVGSCPSSVAVVVKASPDEINYISASNITATLNLDDIVEPGTYNIPINIKVSNNLMEMETFEVKPRQDYITLKVEKKAFKYVPIKVSLAGEPAHGFSVKDISISPVTVEIFGPESVVNSIDYVQTGKVSVANAENSFTTEAYYREINKLIKVDELGPYRVTVSLESQRMEKDFTSTEIAVMNLHSDLKIDSKLPSVNYKLESTVKILEAYEPSKYAVQIDCSSISEPGSYSLPIKILTPGTINLVGKSEEYVSVEISKIHKIEEVEKVTEINIEQE